MAPDEHGRLSTSEVARILGVSQSTVLRIDRRALPYAQTPGGPGGRRHRRYRSEDVERYRRQMDGER